MNRLEDALVQLRDDLDELDVAWALVGGLAVSARSEPRTTLDIDIAVSVADDTEAETLVRDLLGRGYRQLEDGLLEQTATDRLATVRLESPAPLDGTVVIDLLFASSGIEPDIVDQAEAIELLADLVVPVARRHHLIALKILADRAQDRADATTLVRFADEDEIEAAREAIEAIERRGYQRDRDLRSRLDVLVAGESP